jgi:hypothetical protein
MYIEGKKQYNQPHNNEFFFHKDPPYPINKKYILESIIFKLSEAGEIVKKKQEVSAVSFTWALKKR